MRLAMPSGNQEPRRAPELKRKAWLAVFLVLHFSGWLSHC
ncbi:TPA: YmiA family putative membrane protein [Escherichia coli]